MKKIIALMLPLALLVSAVSCAEKGKTSESSSSTEIEVASDSTVKDHGPKYQRYASMSPEEIVKELTLEQKAAQMVQPAVYMVEDDPENTMKLADYGSVLGENSGMEFSCQEWQELTNNLQKGAIASEAGIPFVYGSDHAHGVGYCVNAVYFPHNIGIGAANDEELTYKMGQVVADEARICHMPWNFFPVVSQSVDPRWGRTYECYSSDLGIISKLGSAYIKGYIDGGGIACAKHFFAEGSAAYGTGEDSQNGSQFVDRLIDRGEATLTDAEIKELLDVYQEMINSGVQTIMISHAALNGVKMHENKEYIMKLKDEMGFEGFIVSDWESIQNIPGKDYEEQVITAVNAGIDMLMEVNRADEAAKIIADSVKSGKISEERVDDAVRRIIKVKLENGLFNDPLFENGDTVQKETGSAEYRKIAEQMVEESLVLLKNDKDTLPVKEGSSVYIIGPASDDASAQCGSWTLDWAESYTKDIKGVTTVLEAFKTYAESYGITVITNPDEAKNADLVLVALGEKPYAEWNGDSEDMELCGKLGLDKNRQAIDEAKKLGKPTVACIVAGRQVIIDKADYDSWDSVVMCYLPGSEGKGISDVLCGCADFRGKLPSPWYSSVEQIGTDKCWFEKGYGLNYGSGFKPKAEPEGAAPDDSDDDTYEDPMKGTKYTVGEFKDGVYTSDFAGLKMKMPEGMKHVGEGDIGMFRGSIVSMCSEEKDKVRENARTWEQVFISDDAAIAITYLNTKTAAPDDADYSEEEFLDDYKAFYNPENYGAETEYKERASVKLGGRDYVREIMEVDYEGNKACEYYYARKIDDELMCIINTQCNGTDKTPEYFEKMFS